MPRPFYVIGHNPNSVDEALECLRLGANALEPDINYWEETEEFYVYEPFRFGTPSDDRVPTLDVYLRGVFNGLAEDRRLKLALITFDLKAPYNYEIMDLFSKVRAITEASMPGLPIFMTVPSRSDIPHLLGKNRPLTLLNNEAVGVDQDYPPARVLSDFHRKSHSLTYACGSLGDSYRDGIDYTNAIRIRDQGEQLKFVYAWTVNGRTSMRAFLDLPGQIDGMITDRVDRLLELINEPEYSEKYRLATNEDSPFRARIV